jgi:Ca2+/H+ antiporter, TMEM165/GDT1 family
MIGATMLHLTSFNFAQFGPAMAASFLGSLVEFVETLTIVLAVGTVRGWRPALLGTGAGIAVLTALVASAGPALGLIPLSALQIVVGALLLAFGLRWLRKAVLRAAGIIPLHDEVKIYARETEIMRAAPHALHRWWDTVAVVASFKAMLLEGLEVIFIVIAVGATGNMLVPASVGAAIAGVLVLLVGLALRRPLARVPENTLKWTVGILLSAFGIFWVGEGLGVQWPGGDLSILAIAVALLFGSLAFVTFARRRLAGAS